MKRSNKIILYSISVLGFICAVVVIFILFYISPSFSKENKLIEYVGNGDFEKVKEIVNSGVDVNAPGKWHPWGGSGGWEDGRTPLTQAAEANQLQIAQYLLSKGADINGYDGFGQTPVHVSAQHGQYEITKLFIENNCNLNLMQIKHKFDALSTAAIIGRDKEIVRLMLENGAVLNTPDYVTKMVVKFVTETHDQSLIKQFEEANKQLNQDSDAVTHQPDN